MNTDMECEAFQTLFDMSPEAVLQLDCEGRIQACNPVFTAMTGRSAEALSGLPLWQCPGLNKEGASAVTALIDTILKRRKHLPEALFWRHPDGGQRRLIPQGQILKRDRRIVGIMLILRDDTVAWRQRRLDDALGRLSHLAQRADMHALIKGLLKEAETETGSALSFFHFVNANATGLEMGGWSEQVLAECTVQLSGHRQIPLSVSGFWTDYLAAPTVRMINDSSVLSQMCDFPPGHPPLCRLLCLPVLRNQQVLAVLGLGNKKTDYHQQDVEWAGRLVDAAWDMLHRLRTEAELIARHRLDTAVAEISGRFNTLESADYNEILALLGERVSADRAFIVQLKDAGQRLEHVHTWYAPGEPAAHCSFQSHTARQFPWWMKRLHRGETVAITHAKALPQEAVAERQMMKARGIAALLGVPVKHQDRSLWGFIGFESRHRRGVWHPYEVEVVQVVSKMITVDLERKRVERALIQSRQSYRDIFNSVSEAIYIQDESGAFIDVNHRAELMYGYAREELIGQDPAQVAAPGKNDLDAIAALSAGVFETGEMAAFEFWAHRKTGETFPKEVMVNRGRYFGQDVLITTARDITERKRTEHALTSLATGYASLSGRTFFNAVTAHIARDMGLDVVYVAALDSSQEHVQVLAGHAHGHPMEAMVYSLENTPCDHVVGNRLRVYARDVQSLFPKDADLAHLNAEAYIGSPIFDKAQKPLGIIVGLRSRPIDDEGLITQYFNIFIDRIAAEMMRDQAEAALRESEARNSAILQAIPDLIFRMNRDLIFTDFQVPEGAALLVPEEEIVGGSAEVLLPHDLWVLTREKLDNALSSGEIQLYEYSLDLNGKTHWYDARMVVSAPEEVLIIIRDVTASRQAMALLEESEARIRTTFNAINDAVFLHPWQERGFGRFVDVNEAACTRYGYSRDAFLSLTPADITRSVDIETHRSEDHRSTLMEQGRLVFETTHVTRNGTPIPVEINSAVMVLEGRPMILAVARDITDRKRAEEALKKSEAQYRYLFDNAPLGIVTVDRKGQILEINPALLTLLHFSSVEETRKINVFRFPPFVEAGVSDQFKACLKTGKSLDFEAGYTPKHGQAPFMAYHLVPILNDAQEIVGVQANVQDVSVRKEAEARLKQSYEEVKTNQEATLRLMKSLTEENEERRKAEAKRNEFAARLESVVKAAPIGIGLTENRVFRQVNHRFCQMIGYSEEELLGQSSIMIYEDEVAYLRAGEKKYKLIDQYGTGTIEIKARRKDGTVIDVLLSSSPLEQNDWTKGVTFTTLDITERKKNEAQIRANLREKEVLLKEIHHRVKNNLQIICSLLNLQSMKIENAEMQAALMESRNRINSMSLVHERLYCSSDFSNIAFNDYIRTITRELFSSYEYTSRIELLLDVESIELGIDTAIPCGLLINELVTNALKHAFPDERSGKIFVVFKRERADSFLLRVCDNGVGIRNVEAIKAKGSLGMELVEVLTYQLEGQLIYPNKNKACFTVVFPDPRRQGDDH